MRQKGKARRLLTPGLPFLLPLGITKPLVLPGVSKKALAKEKSKKDGLW